jgi:adenylate cyclase
MRAVPSCQRVPMAIAALWMFLSASGQFNVDSVKQLLARTPDPIEHLQLLRQLSRADDPEVVVTYSRATLRYADSLLAHGYAGNFTVCSLKGVGLWNMGANYARHGMADSSLALQTRAAELWKTIGDTTRMVFGYSNLSISLATLGRPREALAMLPIPFARHQALKDSAGLCSDHTAYATAYYHLGDYPQAIDHYLKALGLAEKVDPYGDGALILNNLANVYKEEGEVDTALVYYERAVHAFERSATPQGAVTPINNIAGIFLDQGKQAEALELYRKGLALVPDGHYPSESCMVNRGLCSAYLAGGDMDTAIMYGERALQAGRNGAVRQVLVNALVVVARAYATKGNYAKGLQLALEARGLCETNVISLEIRSDLASILSDIYMKLGPADKALQYYKEFVTLKDSVVNDENRKHAMRSQFKFAFDKKEALLEAEQDKKDAVAAEELRRKKLQRNAFIGGFGLMVLLAGVFFTQRNRIGKEKKRSEELLLNILPEEVAEELKAKGEAEAKQIDQVTVLFTDFKGFTTMSEKLSPKDLVKDIHECFSAFDHIMEKHGIEKIKTIGDAYMAAGGLPTPNTTHALDVVKAALEIRDFIAEGKERKQAQGLPCFEIRIGIHTGPVVAGIVGVKKFAYDIWGDTVNIASRMESSGEAGQVNISEATYALLKNEPGLTFTPRGNVQAKGKGEMEMYFVHGSLSEA